MYVYLTGLYGTPVIGTFLLLSCQPLVFLAAHYISPVISISLQNVILHEFLMYLLLLFEVN
jgi:hypothetical protein